jgi:hypothetical protein
MTAHEITKVSRDEAVGATGQQNRHPEEHRKNTGRTPEEHRKNTG